MRPEAISTSVTSPFTLFTFAVSFPRRLLLARRAGNSSIPFLTTSPSSEKGEDVFPEKGLPREPEEFLRPLVRDDDLAVFHKVTTAERAISINFRYRSSDSLLCSVFSWSSSIMSLNAPISSPISSLLSAAAFPQSCRFWSHG